MEPKIAQGRAIIQLDKRKIFRIASGSHPALDLNHIDGLSALQSVLYRCWRKLRHVTNKIPPDLRIKLLRKVLQVGDPGRRLPSECHVLYRNRPERQRNEIRLEPVTIALLDTKSRQLDLNLVEGLHFRSNRGGLLFGAVFAAAAALEKTSLSSGERPRNSFACSLFNQIATRSLCSEDRAARYVERWIKYGVLFLVLVFTTFFLFEVTARQKIHPFQYLMVGAALCLFYLLLLSISEFIGFGWAYLIAAVASTMLIT
jgi:hypothetical protein